MQHLLFSLRLCFLSFRSSQEGEESFLSPISNPLPEFIASTLSPLASECLLPWTKSSATQVSVPFTGQEGVCLKEAFYKRKRKALLLHF